MQESLEDRLWETMFRDGQRLLRDGKHDDALKELRGAVNVSEKFEPEDPRRIQSLTSLGLAHVVRREFKEAEPLFRLAINLTAKLNGEDNIEVARLLKHLALVYSNERKFEEAEESCQRAITIFDQASPKHPDLEKLRQQLAAVQKMAADAKRKAEEQEDMLVLIKPKKSATDEAQSEKKQSDQKQPDQKSAGTSKPAPAATPIQSEAVSKQSNQNAESLIGRMLDNRYQVLERVAAGGMSVIYKARHSHLDRIVAIKVMHPHLVSNERNIKRFTQEAKTASSLTHQNIVTVRDFGVTAEGLCYIVMDYVEGETLATRINRQHHLPTAEFVPLCKNIVDALSYAHENKILHRDLKPSNIMLEKSGTKEIAKIVDFGIAKVVSGDEESLSLTQTGETVGSPLYMSPEQCRGQGLDARSDIYSLGCLAYKSLTGFPPFLGATDIDVYFKHINDEPSPLNKTSPESAVPEAMEKIVLQALEKDPVKRQQSMHEVRKQLDDLQV